MTKNLFRYLFFLICTLSLTAITPRGRNLFPPAPATLAELCRAEPERIQQLFDALNLDYSGLEKVKAAARARDWPGACEALVDYYQSGKSTNWYRTQTVAKAAIVHPAADAILADTFTNQNLKARQLRRTPDQMDWTYLGPNNDKEWGFFTNRHIFFRTLLDAYRKTGNQKYVQGFNALATDWVLRNPGPAKQEESVTWRPLEAGLRMANAWPQAFFGFISAEKLSPVTVILMLSQVPDHARYLTRYHARQHNHAIMEMNGLATAALCWPEFKESEQWYSYAMRIAEEELKLEVYPDGAQKELASKYHLVALQYFEEIVQKSKIAGRQAPPIFSQTLKKMYTYLAYTVRPDGYGLLNHDSDLDYNAGLLMAAADTFGREDWRYIVSNGKQGEKPRTGPSALFAWAGHLISRSDWSRNAHWSYFDVGPWGMAHQQNDKLHLSLFANGRELLVDAGRMYYKPDEWRLYVNLSKGHNVVLVDGKGQNQYEDFADKPLDSTTYSIQPELDFCIASYENGFGDKWNKYPPFQYHPGTDPIPGKHTRAVLYLRDQFWVVFDQIETDRPRTVSPLWHFHPDCSVAVDNGSVVTTDAGKGNLRIVPVSDFNWQVTLVKGQEKPEVQGWYSPAYNTKEASTCAVYAAPVAAASQFAWVMLPAKGEVPAVKTERLPAPAGTLRIKVAVPGKAPVEIAVRLSGNGPIQLSNGLRLNGRCAVLRKGQIPLVVHGTLTNADGKVIVRN